MLEKFLESDIFVRMMRVHGSEIVDLLLQEGVNFTVMASLDGVFFDPELPSKITKNFKPIITFALSGYTFESAKVYDKILQFDAGFGEDNIGSLVSVHLDHILQIIVEGNPIYINCAIPATQEDEVYEEEKTEQKEARMDKSMKALLSNPENRKLFD